MSDSLSAVSVVVSSWRTPDLLRRCLRSLEPIRERGAEIIVVDDASGDGSAEQVGTEFPGVDLLPLQDNVGYSRATNLGAARASREFLLLLNADTEVQPGAVEALAHFLRDHPDHGAVAPRLIGSEGKTQRACMDFPKGLTPLFFATPLERWWPKSPELERYFLRTFDHETERDVPQPPAAALMLPRLLWQELGGFDEAFALFFGDVDLARRIGVHRGRPIRYLPQAQVLHRGGASTGQLEDFVARWHSDRLTYYRKHHGFLAGVWVKLCTSLAWAAHVAAWTAKRLRGQSTEPLRPLCRSFGAFLVS